ncbi:hypothetical protein L3Q82_026758 [Scortum barcoo]|uniref:Uncharacterized protein n=1 Tax=Scortum barcoo TaxID=214431 RepID=A0ACB8WJT9_9TELE|nr:hypothetical protein L3Q82_026758 [Scortum barcoo]
MAVSWARAVLWGTSMVFMILPHLNLGLLSDFKICGDPECESLMSRVQAIRDHRGKDCRFLSFRRGDTISVYHKLTGKREDLWAGSIDKQFGYFPKDMVQEEQVFATTVKVVETQKSDFFCMDELGYLIDSSHLDSDDDDDLKIQNQESETSQTTPHTDDTNTESPSTSADPSPESPVSAQAADGTSPEEDKNENAGDETPEEAQEAPAAPNEQGGSASPSWLSSSVTGWLGLAKEDEPGDLAEGEKEDERKETQAEASFTSSVTGWLGLGGEVKPEDGVNGREEERETADSLTSTMTGWLGFGGEKTMDDSAEKEQDEEREEEESGDKFRGRRMHLDLEGSRLHEEEKKEMGTLDWLGNGLSNTLGFGLTNQESGHETTTEREAEEIQEEEEQPEPSSWLDMGIGNILGFKKDKIEVNERTGSGYKEIAGDEALEQPIGSGNVDTSRALTEEGRTETSNESQVEESPKDQNASSEIEAVPDNADLEDKSQAAGGMSSGVTEEGDDVLDGVKKEKNELDNERATEVEDKDHQMLNSLENEGEDNKREQQEEEKEESKTVSDTDQDSFTQSDINLEPDLSTADLNSNSTVQSIGMVEEDKTDDMVEEKVEIPNETEESIDMSVELGAGKDDHEGQVSGAAEESDEKSQSLSPMATTEEGREPITGEDDSLTAHSVEDLDSLAVIGDNTETETHWDVLGQEGEVHHVEGSSQEFGSSHSPFATNGSTTQMESDADQESVSPQQVAAQSNGDAHELKETVKDTRKDNKNNLQQLHTETRGYENESDLKSATGAAAEAEEVEESSDEEKQEEVEELREEVKLEQIKEVEEIKAQEEQEEEEEKRDEVKELKEEDGQQQVTEIEEEVEMKQEETEELKEGETQEVAEELKEKKKQEGKEEVKEDDSQGVLGELREEEKQEEGEEKKDDLQEIKEEKKQEEVEELKEEEKQRQIGELKEENELEDVKEDDKTEELKEADDVKEKEKKELAQSHSEVENVESDSKEKETQHENNNLESERSETSTQTEETQVEEERREEKDKRQEEVVEIKDEMRDGEAEEKQEMETVEGVSRDKEEEGSLNCSGELCSQADEVGRRDGDENDLTDEGAIEAGEPSPIASSDHILAERSGGSQTESFERDEHRKQEEKNRNDDPEAEEGREEKGERKDSQSNQTGNEAVNSNQNLISDLNALGVNKTGEMEDNDLLYSGESGQNSLSDQILLGQTAESKDEGAESVDLSDASRLGEEVKTKPEDTKTSSSGISTEKMIEQTHSDYKIDTKDKEERETSDPVESLISEQTVQHPTGSSPLIDGHSEGTAKAKSGGAFGLFKNTFSFFGQTKESAEPAPSLDSNADETPKTQDPVTPEQELDPTADSSHVNTQDLPTDSLTSLRQQPLPPSPAQTHSHPSPLSPNTGSPLQTKTLFKHYKNLLAYVSADEMAVLMELFGRHKLQFLDYVLGSSDITTDDPDHDESILSDIERLLHYHRETLVAPSMRLTEAPQEDKEKTRTLIALQKLEMLLARVRETFNTGKSDSCNTNQKAETSCVGESCSSSSKYKETTTGEESSMMGDSSPRNGWMGVDKESDESLPHIQLGPQLEEIMKQSLDFVCQMAADSATHVYAAGELLVWLTVQVVSSLPDDIRPGPDLYGVPWEPVIITSLVGLLTLLLFTCRCYSSVTASVKSRMYRSKERWMAEQVAQLLEEKCKVLETLSTCQQEYDELENSLRDSGVLAQTQKTEELEHKAKQLGHANRQLERDLEQLKDQLDQQREHRTEQERRIAALEDSMKTCEEETKDLQSQEEQAQTTLKVYSMNSDRLQKNLETAGEENTLLLHESNAQLRQQVEGWAERVSELEAEMSRCEVSYSAMLQDVTTKDERIMSLTDRLLRMKAWDSELEEEEGEDDGEKDTSNGTAGRGEENGRGDPVDTQRHLQKVQKLIYAAKLNADLKSVDEDKDRAFAKLNDEVKAKEDLQVSIKELENEKISLQSDTEHYTDQVQRLQQKLQIMTEMYQENELKLHRLLTVEEKERLQKEEKLHKADKNIAMAMEELNNYRQRAEEMEEELDKTKQSYQTQISAHEKKAHNNWLAARAADRELADIRRENALLRQKLTDTQFKLDTLDKDPYALNSLARPLPFRAERSPYGPSPLGRPASETRAFLSPPTLMDGPPARLSPRVLRGPVEPPGGLGEMERSGGPHSDSGSISPTWERDRRVPPPGPPGPLGPPGYMFPEPGGPMYRRPPPLPGALGLLPPPGSLPPGPLHPRGLPPGLPHPVDMADGSYRENSLGPGEQEHRESGPGDRRTPPEADPRMGGPPPPGPPMGPIDGPFPRRAPYGPPPPDFYSPRGPGGPPMMPRMMFPPRFPPSGPPLPPHPHHAPPMRLPPPNGFPPSFMGPPPPQQSHPSPPHSQSPEEHAPSPEDAI